MKIVTSLGFDGQCREAPSQLRFTSGEDQVACMSWSERGNPSAAGRRA